MLSEDFLLFHRLLCLEELYGPLVGCCFIVEVIGNIMAVPIIQCIGMGLGILLWGLTSLLVILV